MAQMPIEVVAIGDIPTKQFEGVVSLANSVQTEFKFIGLKDNEVKAFKTLAYKQATVKDVMNKMEAVRADIGGYHPYIIALVDTKLDGERFPNVFGSHRAEKGVAVFTTANVNDVIIPREKIAAYMLYYFARYTLSFTVPDHKNHNETKDCVFDRKIYKPDVIRSMKARAICDECRNQLLSGEIKLSPAQLDAIDMLIELSGKLLNGTVEIAPKANSINPLDALTELSEIKNRLDVNAHRFARHGLWFYSLFLIGVWIILAIFTFRLGWNVMEPWTYFIGGFLTIGSYLYFVITQRELSPKTIYDQIIESKKRKNYKESGLDIDKFEELLDAKDRNISKV
jgi:hypothetical protein